MNKLAPLSDGRWRLAPHAHVIVYETDDGGEFLTIYDCGAAQKPPSAQVIGNLVRVDAAHELVHQPTGYIVKLREDAALVRQGRAAGTAAERSTGERSEPVDVDHFVIRARESDDPTDV